MFITLFVSSFIFFIIPRMRRLNLVRISVIMTDGGGPSSRDLSYLSK